jgi:hypothetical protein
MAMQPDEPDTNSSKNAMHCKLIDEQFLTGA